MLPTALGNPSRLTRLLNLAAGNAVQFADYALWTRRLSARLPAVPPVAAPAEVAAKGFNGANMTHFVDGHTWEYLNIPSRLGKTSTTLWPPGTAPNTIATNLGEALRNLNPVGGPRLPNPGAPLPTTAGGFNVQVGARPAGGGVEIGQFFPVTQPGLVTIARNVMRAIWDILRP